MAILGEDPHLKRVWRYYDRTESRIGYTYLLHGTKHFGWYEAGDSIWQFTRAMRQMEFQLGRRLSLPDGSTVLDAGCGTGDVARTMASKFRLMVTGIDILDFNIDEARERSDKAGLQARTVFQLGDYNHLEFADESFDGVYTMETLVHAADAAQVLSEFRRVLRPGGRLVMFEYSRTPQAQLSSEANEALRRVCELGAMPTWLQMNHGDLERLLKQEDYVVESVENVTDRMMPMLHAFSVIGRLPYFVGRVSGRTSKVVNALSGVEMYKHQEAWQYNIYVASKPS